MKFKIGRHTPIAFFCSEQEETKAQGKRMGPNCRKISCHWLTCGLWGRDDKPHPRVSFLHFLKSLRKRTWGWVPCCGVPFQQQITEDVTMWKKWHTRLATHVPLFCSYYILTSSTINYWTDAHQHRIYSFNNFTWQAVVKLSWPLHEKKELHKSVTLHGTMTPTLLILMSPDMSKINSEAF